MLQKKVAVGLWSQAIRLCRPVHVSVLSFFIALKVLLGMIVTELVEVQLVIKNSTYF